MFKKLILLFLASFSLLLHAQYTELINSNYPGFSQSPYSVGTGVYQLESNFFYRSAEAIPIFDNPTSYGVNVHFRTTFMLDKLELNLQSAFQNDELAFTNVFTTTQNQFSIGQLTIGAKYLVFVPEYEDKTKQIRSWKDRHGFDIKRLIPHFAVYAGANMGSVLGEYHQKGGISPKVGVLLQNELDLRTNLITNIYYNYIGTDFSEWEYIITGTYLLSQRWSGFLEHQATFNSIENKSNVGGGLAYLFTKDLQANCSARATFQESGLGSYFSIGASYRLDRHEDGFTELDEFGNKIEEQEEGKNQGFFSRLFSGLKGLFKKKEKVAYETKDENGNIQEKEIEVKTSTGRKRKKSVVGGLIKDDKKQKKKKTKADEKADRRAKKAAKKADRRAKKAAKKAKKQARKAAEREKLDRIEELEDQQKAIKKQQEEFFGKGDLPTNKTDEEKAIEMEIEQLRKEIEEDKILNEQEDKLEREEELLRQQKEKQGKVKQDTEKQETSDKKKNKEEVKKEPIDGGSGSWRKNNEDDE